MGETVFYFPSDCLIQCFPVFRRIGKGDRQESECRGCDMPEVWSLGAEFSSVIFVCWDCICYVTLRGWKGLWLINGNTSAPSLH